MSRMKGILAAGTLTGLVLITILALGLRNAGADTTNGAETLPAGETQPTLSIPQPPSADQDMAAQIEAWQAYSAELEAALQTMQTREAQYQQQLEAANQSILQLQEQPVGNVSRVSDDGEDEEHEREHESHEYEEHEGYEYDD